MNHYKWLESNLPVFFKNIGIDFTYYNSLITADGDKCAMHESFFEENGLHYCHGVAIYLLLSFQPYSEQVRDTPQGWVNPFVWIVQNKEQFLPHLPPVE